MRATPFSRPIEAIATLGLAACITSGCFERGERWYIQETAGCTAGTQRCRDNQLEQCVQVADKSAWQLESDCATVGQVCSATLLACSACTPGAKRCNGQVALGCGADGRAFETLATCDPKQGEACRSGACVNLCADAHNRRSNVGCEYWAADLDNARISASSNAAAQQFAVVLSNPQPDVSADIVIEQDDSAPGEPGQVLEVARATIPPFSLRVFKLGPREVDGSAPGTFDTGTGTALSRTAYRVRSKFPLVAYQFNPLENVNVFSNDASLLKPLEAVAPDNDAMTDAYVVLSWPQTIAVTDDPRTNFSSSDPINLRAFLTVVGTRPDTHVRVTTSTRVIPGGPVAETAAGGAIEATLDPFDVLNLETGDFNADFSGSLVAADGPVIVFTGSEASDAPSFPDLSKRRCCADHLEEQLDPIRTAGRSYIGTVSPNRARAVVEAGAKLEVIEQPEYFRVIAATSAGARITTTLDGETAHFVLPEKASFVDLVSSNHFALVSDAPVMMTSVSPSQEAANIMRGIPGGDPSLLVIPPIEQFRSTYVFLTPDKYSFDFVRIIAPPEAEIVFDGEPLVDRTGCTLSAIPAPPGSSNPAASLALSWAVYSCQLSFPRIDASGMSALQPGLQDDGVHRLTASKPVGVLVDGFDAFVSYAYAGGTELQFIVPE
ncbi:MAG: IgGFc-binding protein [Polyangiaceae bacterium]